MKKILDMPNHQQFFKLLVMISLLSILIYFFARELLPLLIGLTFTYLLRTPFNYLRQFLSSSWASTVIVLVFWVLVVMLLFLVIPPMISEAYSFLSSLPKILADKQPEITAILDKLSTKVPVATVNDIINTARHYLTDKSATGVMFLINLLPVTFEVLLYFIIVPIMMFFLLRDAKLFTSYISSIAPNYSIMAKKFWSQIDIKLGSYLQGKALEMFIVFLAALLLYAMFELKYSLLMAGLMGVFVLIPVFGAIIATLPVVLVAFWQFGGTSSFIYLMLGHLVLLAVDANFLVPLLFSEKLELHPLVILVGILLFGAFLGFWGLFFAIPLLIVLSLLLENYKQNFVD